MSAFYKYLFNKSKTKASKDYWIVCLSSINICYIFVYYKLFDFFWNMFYCKICSHYDHLHSKLSNELQLTCTHKDFLHMLHLLSKLLLEWAPLNFVSLWYFCISKLVKGWGAALNILIQDICFFTSSHYALSRYVSSHS